ncbi:MAG: porin [Boseongicola sp.]|nr:porin [Boseongicola sp.]
MKKVILGTTALVLTAGVAFADAHAGVSVGGSAEFAVGQSGSGDITTSPDIAISFAGSGESDGGLGFGFDYTITNADSNGQVNKDNWEVYISGSWGKLTMGDPDDALQSVAGIGDIGFNGLGVDNVAEFGRGAGVGGQPANGLLYSNTIGSVGVYASTSSAIGEGDSAFGVKVATGAVTIGLGYRDVDGGPVSDVLALDLSGDLGGLGFDVYYEDHDLGSNYGTILSYDAGAATIQFGYADGDNAPGDAAMGVGFSMDLGGGAELAGGVADDGVDTNWDLGIGMSF